MFKSELSDSAGDWLSSMNFTNNMQQVFGDLTSNELLTSSDEPLVYSNALGDSFLPNPNLELDNIYSGFDKFTNLFDNLSKSSFNTTSNTVGAKEATNNETSSKLRFLFKLHNALQYNCVMELTY